MWAYMKIVIPYWQGRVSPVFDTANRAMLFSFEGGLEVLRENRDLLCKDPLSKAREVSRFGADVLICGAISRPFESALQAAGVKTLAFICGDLDDVVSAFMNKTLTDHFLMPGCCRRRRIRSRGVRRERPGEFFTDTPDKADGE